MPLDPQEFDQELSDLPQEDEFGQNAISLTVQYKISDIPWYEIGMSKGGGCTHKYCFGEEFPWYPYYTRKIASDGNLLILKFTLISPGPEEEAAEEVLNQILEKFKPGTIVYQSRRGKGGVIVNKIEGKIISWKPDPYEDYPGY